MKELKMKELKPCPFCGGKATIIKQEVPEPMKTMWGDDAPKEVMTVGCDTLECLLYHRHGSARLMFMPDNIDILVERWNRRYVEFSKEDCCYNCKHFDKIADVYECANECSELYEEEIEPWDICEDFEMR